MNRSNTKAGLFWSIISLGLKVLVESNKNTQGLKPSPWPLGRHDEVLERALVLCGSGLRHGQHVGISKVPSCE